jgi:thiol:disulfide interchange protein DsbD
MKTRSFPLFRALLALALTQAACAACCFAQTRGDRDVFDVANRVKDVTAKDDPFGLQNKAAAADVKPAKPEPTQPTQSIPDRGEYPPRNPRIAFEVTASPREVQRGTMVRVTVKGMPKQGYHAYSMTKVTPQQAGRNISKFEVASIRGLKPLGPIEESPPTLRSLVVNAQTQDTFWYFEHSENFTWSFDVLVEPDALPGPSALPLTMVLEVCNQGTCVNVDATLKAKFTVSAAPPVEVNAELKQRSIDRFPPPPKVEGEATLQPKAAKSTDEPAPAAEYMPRDYEASLKRVQQKIKAPDVAPMEGLVAFMLTGMFWGFVSLITPCVFPMIPITVSFFLKQSEKEHHRPVAMALVYCGTIVLVLTIAAAALLTFFRLLSINPFMNFGMGLLFIFFALSLFGMYEIELPSFLARFTSEREGKGGYVGTIFMALTFTIISFACVAPFLGGFGGTASSATRPMWHTILGGLAFSATFASPFFLLALFPTLLKAMPKSGSWLNSVKVVMGFLELAAALKFLRAGDLGLPSPLGFFTFDLVLGMWVALCVLCGLYLIGAYRLPHDSPADHVSVPRLVFSVVFLGLAIYLAPALIINPQESGPTRPAGGVYAWVNSFLLPEPRVGKDEMWTPNLESAIAQAREYRQKTGKPKFVFIDFTGEYCTNCKLNENNVFSKSEMRQLFKPYILARMYCDTVPVSYYAPDDRAAAESGRRETDARLNTKFETDVFNTAALPLYVILEPQLDGSVTVGGQFEGLVQNEAEFAEFLRKPQTKAGGGDQAGL